MNIKLHSKCNSRILSNYGFKKQKDSYILMLPLYMYKDHPVIEVKFIISLEEQYIHFDIVNSNLNSIYAAYYDYGNSNTNGNKVLKIVKKNLNKIIQSMKHSKIITGEKFSLKERCLKSI